MMRKNALIAALSALPLAGLLASCGPDSFPIAAAHAAEPAPVKVVKADLPGRVIFERQCAPCHAAGPGDDGMPMLPGTMALAKKYEGALPGPLELREDLSAPVIRIFVRNGSGAMPMFRKSELTDADIELLADYIAKTAELSK